MLAAAENVDDAWRVNDALDIIDLLDDEPRTLGISGGEPTTLGGGFFENSDPLPPEIAANPASCFDQWKNLSNRELIDEIQQIGHERVLWGVPLYGAMARDHDYHVQSRGAFNQTINGLYHLKRLNSPSNCGSS